MSSDEYLSVLSNMNAVHVPTSRITEEPVSSSIKENIPAKLYGSSPSRKKNPRENEEVSFDGQELESRLINDLIEEEDIEVREIALYLKN